MTEYVCHECGVKTTMNPFLDMDTSLPMTDQCPNCGEQEEFEYL